MTVETPTAIVGPELEKLADQVLAFAQEREQKLWTVQLDVRDLRNQLQKHEERAESASAQSLVVRPPNTRVHVAGQGTYLT